MNWFIIIPIALTLGHLYTLILHIVQARSADNPVPENVSDVYDGETYIKWKSYNKETSRFAIITTCLQWALSMALLLSGAYSAFADLFPGNVFMQLLAVVLLDSGTSFILDIFTQYYGSMVIEEKYGFNKCTVKTFIFDRLRSLILGLVLSVALSYLLATIHMAVGDWLVLIFALVMFVITLLISFLFPVLNRLGNKFTPLEEGELRDRLMELLTRHGYRVKDIKVMDASRRTTKLNAYFAGFGKLKTIVLYDNLVNAMTADEICAVFSHELGHGLHKDVLKRQIMNFGNLLIMGLLVWLVVKAPEMHTAFGFEGVNYGFAYIVLSAFLGLIQPLTGMLMNAYSRFAEYRADRQAVKEGYGPYLAAGLKLLAKENFAHLAPNKALVVLQYTHPPLHLRIAAIEKALEESESK